MSLADRILGSLDRLASTAAAREGLPDPRYLATWSYSVTSSTETSFTGRALSARCPQPDLPDIPLMPGIPGTLLRPAAGSVVGVVFLDGDPAQPRCFTWDQASAVVVKLRAAADPSAPAATLEIAPSGVQVYQEPNAPPAQPVAMAVPVTTFASASVTLATAGGILETASGVFAAAIGACVPVVASPLSTDAAFSTAIGTYQSAIGAYIGAVNVYLAAVNALIGTFPTGFTATKLNTQ